MRRGQRQPKDKVISLFPPGDTNHK